MARLPSVPGWILNGRGRDYREQQLCTVNSLFGTNMAHCSLIVLVWLHLMYFRLPHRVNDSQSEQRVSLIFCLFINIFERHLFKLYRESQVTEPAAITVFSKI